MYYITIVNFSSDMNYSEIFDNAWLKAEITAHLEAWAYPLNRGLCAKKFGIF